MYVRLLLTVAAIAGAAAAQDQRRATLTSGGNTARGKCTIEVVVDGAAEIEIRGDMATLRDAGGQRPQWRRFECTGAMPANPADFRFAGVDGRGKQQLIRDPRDGGVAVVRIEDPQGGSEGYTFDLIWNGGAGYARSQDVNRPDERPLDPRFPSRRGLPDGAYNSRIAADEAVRVCQDAVRQQAAERFRSTNITFRRTALDDAPGRGDWVIGTFGVRRGYDREETYRFSCSVNFDSGRVRSAQIDSVESRSYGNVAPGNVPPSNLATQSCQRAAEQRIRADGYERIDFGSVNVDDRPGRNDSIMGTARAEGRDGRSESFDFSCSVDLRDGDVRSVNVQRQTRR
jgi:hypothetical protein